MTELPKPDGCSISVTAEPNTDQVTVAQQSTCGKRGHAPMDTIESVRGAKEISWSLAGATYSAHLSNLMGFDAHFIESLSDLAGNGIVTTTGAERRG
jgi:hypothetical protein